jgi:hypothetical protein
MAVVAIAKVEMNFILFFRYKKVGFFIVDF